MINARILVSEESLISFRYQYLYYYYIAKWISGNREKDSASKMLDELIDKIHTERSSNVIMFVAHFGQEDWVLQKIIPLAKSLFREKLECVLVERAPLAAKFSDSRAKTTLLLGSPDEVSNHHHDQEDRVDNSAVDEPIDDAFKFNTSVRIMQNLGQILRSRAGGVDAESKIIIAEEIISLARRLMSMLYDIAEESAESLIEHASDIFETDLKIDSVQASNLANRLVGAIVGAIAKSLVAKAADALASRELLPLIEKMEENSNEINNKDSLLILLVSRVMAEIDYPKERVELYLKNLKKSDILSRGALAHSVARRFYLQPPPHAVRDSACARLGIEIKRIPGDKEKLAPPNFRIQ